MSQTRKKEVNKYENYNKTVKNTQNKISSKFEDLKEDMLPLTTYYFIFEKDILDNNPKLINALKLHFINNKPEEKEKAERKQIIDYLNKLNTSTQATATTQGVFNLDSKIHIIHFLLVLQYIQDNYVQKSEELYSPHLKEYTEKALEAITSKIEKNRVAKTLNKVRVWKDSNETVSEVDVLILKKIDGFLPKIVGDDKPEKYDRNKAFQEIQNIMKEFNNTPIVKENVSVSKQSNKDKDKNELTKYDIDAYTKTYIELSINIPDFMNVQNKDDIYMYLVKNIDDKLFNHTIHDIIPILNAKINELDGMKIEDANKENEKRRQLHGDILFLIMEISEIYNEFTFINSSNFMTYTYDIKGVSNELQMHKLLKIFDIAYFTEKREFIEENYDSVLYFFYEKLLLYYKSKAVLVYDNTFRTLFCIFYYCSMCYMATDPKLKKALPKHMLGMFTDSKALSRLIHISVIDNIMFTLHAILDLENKKKTTKITKEDELCKKWEKYLMEPVVKEGVLDVKLLEDLKTEFQTTMEDLEKNITANNPKNGSIVFKEENKEIIDKIYTSFFNKTHKTWFTDRFNTIKVFKDDRKEVVAIIQNNNKVKRPSSTSTNTSGISNVSWNLTSSVFSIPGATFLALILASVLG